MRCSNTTGQLNWWQWLQSRDKLTVDFGQHAYHYWDGGGVGLLYTLLWIAKKGPKPEEPHHLNPKLLLFIKTDLCSSKEESKTKKRMKEEEIEKGDCGLPTRKIFFFWDFVLNQAVPNHLADESQMR